MLPNVYYVVGSWRQGFNICVGNWQRRLSGWWLQLRWICVQHLHVVGRLHLGPRSEHVLQRSLSFNHRRGVHRRSAQYARRCRLFFAQDQSGLFARHIFPLVFNYRVFFGNVIIRPRDRKIRANKPVSKYIRKFYMHMHYHRQKY